MPPLRVVSLCPSITETIVAIGGLKAIAGVTRYCTRPSGMLWGLPRVGGTKSPNMPRILDLKPDVVFANAEENRKEDVEALRAAGIEVDVTLPKTVREVPRAIRQWGRRLATEGEANALADRIEEEIRKLEARPPAATFRYAYWIWKDPWMTISDDTYVADLIRLAGGVNVYGNEKTRYPTTTPGGSGGPATRRARLSQRALPVHRREARRSDRAALRAGEPPSLRPRRRLLLARRPNARGAEGRPDLIKLR